MMVNVLTHSLCIHVVPCKWPQVVRLVSLCHLQTVTPVHAGFVLPADTYPFRVLRTAVCRDAIRPVPVRYCPSLYCLTHSKQVWRNYGSHNHDNIQCNIWVYRYMWTAVYIRVIKTYMYGLTMACWIMSLYCVAFISGVLFLVFAVNISA